MENLIGNNAALSLFNLLLGDCLPIEVDTSAGSCFSFPLLFIDPYHSGDFCLRLVHEFRYFTIRVIHS